MLLLRGAVPRRACSMSVASRCIDYLNGLNSLSTEFTQTVTDAHGHAGRSGQRDSAWCSGRAVSLGLPPEAATRATVKAQRRRAPACRQRRRSGQLMVADGKNLWFYDRELAQVTVKPIDAALSSTPIMLLSSSPEQLRETFDITPAARTMA